MTECDGCGLAPCDLPDGVDPELVFQPDGQGHTYCQGCAMGDRSGTWSVDLPAGGVDHD